MHILIIPSWYKTLEEPLEGTFFEEQARALIKAGHKVVLIYPCLYPFKQMFGKKMRVNSFINDNGLLTYSFIVQSLIPRGRNFNYRLMCWKTASVLKGYIAEHGMPDIIHAHSVFYAGIVAKYLSEKLHKPFVLTEHLTHYMTGGISSTVDRWNAKNVLESTSKAIAVSTVFKNQLVKFTGLNADKFSVISNLVNDLFFKDFVIKNYKPGDVFEFFTNSFLNPRKNHKLIFDAIKILTDKNYKVRLRVGGYGEIENELKAYCNEIGIENLVTFTGALKREEVKGELDQCHAFLLASKLETFGVVLIEALACGKPIITTDCGGPMDIINDFNGLMVKSFDPTDYAAAMENLMQNYTNYNPQRISDDCNLRFSQKTIVEKLTALYEEVCNSKKD